MGGDFNFGKRSFSNSSSPDRTPDTSVRFGFRDFNPDDFSYEIHNIVRMSENTIND